MSTPYYPYKLRPFPPDLGFPREPDWPAILNEFLRRGVSKAELARNLCVSRDRIYCYLHGTRAVTYGEGILLISALKVLRASSHEKNPNSQDRALDPLVPNS